MKNTRKGFTGIELVIVIAIIAILAATLIPTFGGLIDSANKTADLQAAKEMGMKLLYHNHDFEFLKIDGKYALDILYDTVSQDLLATEIDTCWVNVGGEEPAAYVEKYTGRAPVVHLKDFAGQKGNGPLYKLIGIDEEEAADNANTFEFRPVGSGCQDWKKIVAAAEKAGAEWVVVEQDDPSMGKTPMECAEMSIGYVKTL